MIGGKGTFGFEGSGPGMQHEAWELGVQCGLQGGAWASCVGKWVFSRGASGGGVRLVGDVIGRAKKWSLGIWPRVRNLFQWLGTIGVRHLCCILFLLRT